MAQAWLERTERLLGPAALRRLETARVAVLGLGGVGSAAAEALRRSGIGQLLVVDGDRVDLTNLNRQLLATQDTVGKPKALVMAERLREIAPGGQVEALERFYLPEQSGFLYDWQPDCVLDCIDMVTAKLHLAQTCQQRGIRLISCMGTGNRLDPSQLRQGDLAETAGGCGCGLARVIRRELRKRGIIHLPVVYSLEPPLPPAAAAPAENGRHPPASAAFVPPAAGFLMASWAVRRLLEE